MGYPRSARITRGAELQAVMREGKRIRTSHLDVRIHASPCAQEDARRLRVGIIVPRYAHSAVDRNRLKRRLRELVRLHVLNCSIAGDLVIRVRPHTYDVDFATLLANIGMIVSQLHQLSQPRAT